MIEIEFELECDFALVEKIFVSRSLSYKNLLKKKSKIKMKNEEEKMQLLIELLYIYHLSIRESLIFQHYEFLI